MVKIKSILFSGLIVLVPLLVTILLIYWIYIGFEGIFRSLLLLFINPSMYFHGLGWISAIIFTALLGLLMQIPLAHSLTEKLKHQLLKLPVIKTLYRMTADLMTFITKKGMKQGKIVKFETPVGALLGIMTQDQLKDLDEGVGGENEVAVYVPMSYQIGGFTFIVPKDSVQILDISVQKGLEMTMTAYISGVGKE